MNVFAVFVCLLLLRLSNDMRTQIGFENVIKFIEGYKDQPIQKTVIESARFELYIKTTCLTGTVSDGYWDSCDRSREIACIGCFFLFS